MEFDVIEKEVSIPADTKTLIAVFGLSPVEASFLQVLLKQNWVGPDEFPELNYPVRQLIYTMRKKLELKMRIWIINDGRGKYCIPNNSKRAISALLQKALNSGE
jgi:hypothetical protein